MAEYIPPDEITRMLDVLVARQIDGVNVRVTAHSGQAGDDGASNRLGDAMSNELGSSDWEAPSGGSVVSARPVQVGVLSNTQSVTVRTYGLWRTGNRATLGNFLGWADLAAPITVPAGDVFRLAAGTIGFRVMT